MKKTLYLNVEDDVGKIITKIKAQKADKIVLVIPKNSYLFADAINLMLLKKQTDLLGRDVRILTMDKTGQEFASEAGFQLQTLPTIKRSHSLSDVRVSPNKNLKSIIEVNENTEPESIKPKARIPKASLGQHQKKTLKKVETNRINSKSFAPEISSSKIYKDRINSISSSQVEQDFREVSPQSERKETELVKKENVYFPAETSQSDKPVVRKSFTKWVLGFVSVALIIALILGLVVLPGATVVVYASQQPVSRDLDITVDSSTSKPDAGRLTLPATKVEQTSSGQDSLTVNGKSEIGSKAEGRVAIYNLTGSALTLKASTTILTVGSKNYLFKTDQPNIVPLPSAQKDSNATVADIIAQDGGEDFNLPAGTRMEITNQAFGSQPQRLYATTITQVIGGSSRFVSVVSQDDINAVQKKLTEKAVAEINSGLANGQKLVEGAYNVDLQNFTSDKQLNDQATTLNASANVAISGLAFNEQDLREMVRQRLLQTIGTDKTLQDISSDNVVYKIKNFDINSGIMTLSIHYESKAIPVIDDRNVISDLVGKTKQQASDLILTNPNVDKVEINLRPFWQHKLPRIGSKIEIQVNIN